MTFATATAAIANTSSCSSSGVRFTLRKRSIRPTTTTNEREPAMTLASYNSDFLSGLFADVAKVNVLSEFNIPEPSPTTTTAATTSAVVSAALAAVNAAPSTHHNIIEDHRPTKKSRLSLSTYRSRASFMNLADLSTTTSTSTSTSGMQSPKGINEIASLQKGHTVTPSRQTSTITNSSSSTTTAENLLMKQQNSLAFQLSLLGGEEEEQQQQVGEGSESSSSTTSPVSSSSNNNNNSYKVEDIAKLAFPNLPATVSDSSCYKGLTRENKARHVSACEAATSPSSYFGWFVDLDDHHGSPNSTSTPTTNVLTHAVSTHDLAFKAPTAPKRSADDADEIEWAQAADTVDSVLGDLF